MDVALEIILKYLVEPRLSKIATNQKMGFGDEKYKANKVTM